MPKIAYFPMDLEGMTALSEFQQHNEILNFRFGKFDITQSNPTMDVGYQGYDKERGNRSSYQPGTWMQVVLYIPISNIAQHPENKRDNDGKSDTVPSTGAKTSVPKESKSN